MQGEIEVELTHECNWDCPYCAIKVHSLPKISEFEMRQKVLSIPENSVVTLSGGEPGMLDQSAVEWILSTLLNRKCKLFLNTNGLFLKKYPQFTGCFSQIVYHCSQNLDVDDEIITVSGADVRYMLVVNDDNVGKLSDFLDAHPGIRFDIIQATYNNIGDGVPLSAKNRNMIATRFFSRMTEESFRRLFNEKNWDAIRFI